MGAPLVFLFAGCISNSKVLTPVGPDAMAQAAAGSSGYLQVFSATEKSTPFASDDRTYFNLHTGYDINDTTGKSIRFEANHMSNMDEWPDKVILPAGSYSIVAESTCCGLVTVPVAIEKGKITNVYLDGNWWPQSSTSTNDLVYLADGETVGWKSSIPLQQLHPSIKSSH